jgi:hypothetical protein
MLNREILLKQLNKKYRIRRVNIALNSTLEKRKC